VSYLAKDNIHFVVFYPEILKLDSNQGNFLQAKLFFVKNIFLQKIKKVLPEPHASLAGGEILGSKQALGQNLLDKFRTTGVVHIVVLSGYNVTIVADAIAKSLSFLPRIFGGALGIIGIILFALITGAGATIVRASIMASLVVIARIFGREADALRLLFIAGLFMVLHNPSIVLYDISFQLSFLATYGLIVISPRIEKYFLWVPEKFQFREITLATISTQIFVLPLLVHNIGELSLVSLPVNLLVLIVVPMTMLFGFLTGLISIILPLLAWPFAFVSFLLLEYQIRLVDFFSGIPFASIKIPSMPYFVPILLYILIFWWLYWSRDKNKNLP
jgi:competence protein ComEC